MLLLALMLFSTACGVPVTTKARSTADGGAPRCTLLRWGWEPAQTQCPEGAACSNGMCICPEGAAADCGDACRTLSSDLLNCGACGVTCAVGASCTAGTCTCPAGSIVCDGRCVVGTASPNCGACGTVCANGGECVGGRCGCSLEAAKDCGGTCRDLQADVSNCGTCGTQCPTGAGCSSGVCLCASSGTACGGVCRDLFADTGNCGACGLSCPLGANVAAASCSAGVCGLRCAVGAGNCDAEAGNGCESPLLTDRAHCGACGVSCAASQVCGSGSCQFCPRGIVLGALPFQNLQQFPGANGPRFGVVADFNRDGKPDLATANFNGNNVSLSTGFGDGTFNTTQVFSVVGTGPRSLALGDFNQDGDLDLVTANSGSNNVSVLLGNGNGTFRAQLLLGVGVSPSSVAVGDFNRDGWADVVCANAGSTNVGVLLGNGDGTFRAQATFALSSSATSVAVGDLNHDGAADLIMTGPSRGVLLVPGNGDGTFAAETPNSFVIGGTVSSASADFNADGHLDVLAVETQRLRVLLGNGVGGFSGDRVYPLTPPPTSIAIGDFDRDGKPDVAAVSMNPTATLRVLRGRGDGTFEPQVMLAVGGPSPSFVVVGDVDADGYQDLLTANTMPSGAASLLSVLLGKANGTFVGQTLTPITSTNLLFGVGDVDGDSTLDVVSAVGVLAGKGDGTFRVLSTASVATDPVLLSVVDLNRDARADVIIVERYAASVGVRMNNGDGTFGALAAFSLGLYPTSLHADDFNGDGSIDIMALTPAGSVLLRGTGLGTFLAPTSSGQCSMNMQCSFAFGDFNNDGRTDFVRGLGPLLTVLLGNATGFFSAQPAVAVGSNVGAMLTGDLTGDGKVDLLASQGGATGTTFSVLLGTGTGALVRGPAFIAAEPNARPLALSDVNGDRLVDLVTSEGSLASGGTALRVRLGDGTGAFGPAALFSLNQSALTVGIVRDFTGDGRPDVLTGGGTGGSGFVGVSVMLNSCSPR